MCLCICEEEGNRRIQRMYICAYPYWDTRRKVFWANDKRAAKTHTQDAEDDLWKKQKNTNNMSA